ncbi:AMP phosphorylase [Candidatus Woesearchaeota archaeon]|nr:AMP phosphorylase [Candidatus Woesearchaeota archaeon]
MRLRVKDMDIATGGVSIVLLNSKDALEMDLHAMDRVLVNKGKIMHTAIVDIGESRKAVRPGKIGFFEETMDDMRAREGDVVEVSVANKPVSVQYIKKKLEGKILTRKEIDCIVKDIVDENLTDVELTYFVSACYANDMTLTETVNLTKAIVRHGGQLKIRGRKLMDKHCTGGVPGNRTTMMIVPIVTAAGLTMPKTSSRSITSPAGTADTMEVIAPVSIPIPRMKQIINNVGGCIVWGGAFSLAQADDKLIQVRHPMSLDPEGMLLSSIIAKKAAVNSTHVLVDIPLGPDTKIRTRKEAEHLEREFKKVGKRLGIKMHVMISKGNQPIGNGMGPALEARDALWILRNDQRAPRDLRKKGLYMAGRLMQIAGLKDPFKKAEQLLVSGKAYEKMKEIISAQGGDPEVDPEKIPVGRHTHTVRAGKSGKIADMNNIIFSRTARIAGAPLDKGAGIYLHDIKERMKVRKGQKLYTIYAESKEKLRYAFEAVKSSPPVSIR